MEFLTNLLRKLRLSKPRTYRYEPRLSEMNRLNAVKEVMDKKAKARHFEGDLLNGWEHDGEPKHWHTRYFDRRKK